MPPLCLPSALKVFSVSRSSFNNNNNKKKRFGSQSDFIWKKFCMASTPGHWQEENLSKFSSRITHAIEMITPLIMLIEDIKY